MSVRRGPTERDRSEGTPTKEEPNQEHKPLVTWGFIKSLAGGEMSAVRQAPLSRTAHSGTSALGDTRTRGQINLR
ncbi:hypothetical protein AO263_17825 [Pseudomonas sp. NZIPFR-PS5]|nr:hypothetical protein AO263_17825 [Pseudomonas sp. NZIPFR-PS5]